MRLRTALAAALIFTSQAGRAQTVDPSYSASYSVVDLGSITGVPPKYGGMIFKDANTLWVSGHAINASGLYYSVPLTRGAGGHVVSLGSPTALGFGTLSDGGIAFAPGGVLFYTQNPVNSMAQVLPPNYTADYLTTSLTALGISPSVGALNFVPGGYQGAGQFKVVTIDTDDFYTVPLTPDGNGGYTLGQAMRVTTLNTCAKACGAEGFQYVPLGSPLFPSQSMIMAEYFSDSVGSYSIDANGNPVPSSRRNFINGMIGAQAAAVDPVTGDMFIASFGQPNKLIEVRGFAPPLSPVGSLTQVAAAGGWDTLATLVNLGASAAKAHADYYDNNGNPLSIPLNPLAAATPPVTASSFDQTLNPNASVTIDATGDAAQTSVTGWSQLQTTGSVSGFGIFRFPALKWEAVVPLETRTANRYILAFDNTGTLATGVAVVNLDFAPASVPVIIRDDTGAQIGPAAISLPALGHTSFLLNQQYPATANKRGTIEFDTPSGGRISTLGLRANGGALTTLPVLANVGTSGGSITHATYNGGFTSVFFLVNTGTATANFTLNFFEESGNPLTVPLSLPQSGGAANTSSLTKSLAAGEMLVAETQANDAAPAVVGSAQLTTNGNISAFEIFRWTTFGQEASVPLETRTPSSFVLPFDDTGALTTGVALANISSAGAAITVKIYDDTGALLQTAAINLAGRGHTSFLLPNNFPSAANKRGMAEFVVPAGGQISAVGLRAKADGTLTTIPILTK